LIQESFVVFSPARTGSSLIVGNLNRYFNTSVVQMHDQHWTPPNNNYTCILSKRENIIDSTLSQLLVSLTHEASIYSNKNLDTFVFNPEQFINIYQLQRDFYKEIDVSKYQKVIEIWYEPLMSDSYYLFQQLDIIEQTVYDKTNKSVYNYNNLITNIDQLRQIAKRLDLYDDVAVVAELEEERKRNYNELR
jgi:hypothetical protein